MIIISHRGNLDGPIPEKENTIQYIDDAIHEGYDVEIDIRVKDKLLYLGHDFAQYKITYKQVLLRSDKLWIHCKDIESFSYCKNFKSFCHTGDPFVLVSNVCVWVHDLNLKLTDISIIPLLSKKDIDNFDLSRAKNIYGICTDYPRYLKSKLNE